jgi:hypothetical protein
MLVASYNTTRDTGQHAAFSCIVWDAGFATLNSLYGESQYMQTSESWQRPKT